MIKSAALINEWDDWINSRTPISESGIHTKYTTIESLFGHSLSGYSMTLKCDLNISCVELFLKETNINCFHHVYFIQFSAKITLVANVQNKVHPIFSSIKIIHLWTCGKIFLTSTRFLSYMLKNILLIFCRHGHNILKKISPAYIIMFTCSCSCSQACGLASLNHLLLVNPHSKSLSLLWCHGVSAFCWHPIMSTLTSFLLWNSLHSLYVFAFHKQFASLIM
jgi:hypothetical protein